MASAEETIARVAAAEWSIKVRVAINVHFLDSLAILEPNFRPAE